MLARASLLLHAGSLHGLRKRAHMSMGFALPLPFGASATGAQGLTLKEGKPMNTTVQTRISLIKSEWPASTRVATVSGRCRRSTPSARSRCASPSMRSACSASSSATGCASIACAVPQQSLGT